MTTIAFSSGSIAADTQLSDEALLYRVQKIDTLPDGSLIGGAGDWSKAFRYMHWLKEGSVGTPPKLKGAILIKITPDGMIWFNEGHGFYPLLNKDNVAIGSGAQAAMALMDQGKTAVEAVRAVSSLDPNTSTPVQVLSLPNVKPPRTKARRDNAPNTLSTVRGPNKA